MKCVDTSQGTSHVASAERVGTPELVGAENGVVVHSEVVGAFKPGPRLRVELLVSLCEPAAELHHVIEGEGIAVVPARIQPFT